MKEYEADEVSQKTAGLILQIIENGKPDFPAVRK